MQIPQTAILHKMPAEYFETGGIITNMLRAAGYIESGYVTIRDLNAWGWTFGKFSEFIQDCLLKQFTMEFHTELSEAVITQMHGFNFFAECAEDIVKYGASSGFYGFIYYLDTVDFYKKNRSSILNLLKEQAQETGLMSTAIGFAKSLIDGVDYDDIAATLYGTDDQFDTWTANSLAWHALESVAAAYLDYTEKAKNN